MVSRGILTYFDESSELPYYYDPASGRTSWRYPHRDAPPPLATPLSTLRLESIASDHYAMFHECPTLATARAMKRLIFRRTLGLALKSGMKPDTVLKRLVNSHGCMRRVLAFFDIDVEESTIRLDCAGLPTMDQSRLWHMLRGYKVWSTNGVPALAVISRQFKVERHATIISFALATVVRPLGVVVEASIEEDVAGDGTGGSVIVPWGAYGTYDHVGRIKLNHGPSKYSPALLPVATAATSFVLRVRHVAGPGAGHPPHRHSPPKLNTAGIALFRAHGYMP